jgi:hypothetical protein
MCLMSRAGCKSSDLFCGVTCVYISYSEIYGKLRLNEYLIECSLSQLDLGRIKAMAVAVSTADIAQRCISCYSRYRKAYP